MKKRINLSYLLLALFSILFIRGYFLTQSVFNLTYSEFKGQLQKDNIKELTISGDRVTGTLTTPIDGKTQFTTTLVEPELAKELDKFNVKYGRIIESTWLTDIISLLLPIILFMGIWYFFIRRAFSKNLGGGAGGNFMAIGKSKAKIYVETDTKVTFKDVAGADEALEELKEIIDFLKNSEKVKTLGGKMPKGVLLVGPPGTGKTLIAKAVAGEAGVPFFSTNGAEFVEMFVGVGAARVRDLFEQAKKQAPCIIFIDELDALGKVRHQSPMGSNDEKEQTLNQLLVEMDGFDTQSGIIILSATNRPEILDPALLRSGRFDRQVLIDKPDRKGRTDILRIHAKKVNLDANLDLEKIASLTPGFSGADLANLVNEAALVATRENASTINLHHFTKAIERMVAGLEKKNRLLNDFERKVVAHHEMGHALMGMLFNKDEAIHKVSIIPRGIGSLGYTIQRPTEDRYLMTKQELENKMTVLMGGRAAENLIFSHFSTGAADDMAKATSIAREMVLRYGMSDELGHVSYEEGPNYLGDRSSNYLSSKYSAETANLIDKIVKDLVGAAFERALKTLKDNKSLLKQSAAELLEKETLNEEELKPYFEKIKSLKSS